LHSTIVNCKYFNCKFYRVSISISNLSKNYAGQSVLNNVSFDIGDGEVVGFLGPNGAGKTTTMKIIAGALSYHIGSVKVCGMEVKDDSLQTNALIGYLPEQNPLYPEMYVKEYLLFVAEAHGIDKGKEKLVDELIDKVGLRPEFYKKIGQLSKGYRQRVGLAQALIPNPRVLILDEPTTGLDPNQLEEIRNLIRELGKDRTVIFSTHIMQEIKAICNRVLIINKGEIVADYPDISKINLFDENDLQFEVEFLREAEIAGIENISSVSLKGNSTYTILSSKDIREEINNLKDDILKINDLKSDSKDFLYELKQTVSELKSVISGLETDIKYLKLDFKSLYEQSASKDYVQNIFNKNVINNDAFFNMATKSVSGIVDIGKQLFLNVNNPKTEQKENQNTSETPKNQD